MKKKTTETKLKTALEVLAFIYASAIPAENKKDKSDDYWVKINLTKLQSKIIKKGFSENVHTQTVMKCSLTLCQKTQAFGVVKLALSVNVFIGYFVHDVRTASV